MQQHVVHLQMPNHNDDNSPDNHGRNHYNAIYNDQHGSIYDRIIDDHDDLSADRGLRDRP